MGGQREINEIFVGEEGEYRVNGRLSFDKRENGVVENHHSTGNISGNTDLMRLTKLYNQIKSK